MEASEGILKEEENDGNNLGAKTSKEHKTPRKVIYFANGESMEEYSTEEEDAEENKPEPLINTANLSWGGYLRFWALRIAATSFFTCEFLGGKFAALFGLTQAKYQYAIDEYYRTQKKESESDEDGEEMPETEAAFPPNEKEHLRMQSLRYGSIHCREMPASSQETTVVNELQKDSLPGFK
ncbi:protein FAM177B isoform X4 [Pogona vitticeps]|uniref:Protein FAM177B isoform X3 n=1 Tax=Pogona vitticeps TaxID=103695 RepID=A0A6J0T0Y7_9SAUR